MKAVVQRVKAASLKVQGRLVSEIPFGLVVFFGVKVGDDEAKADYIVKKIANLRIFEDEDGKMNLSVKDVGGEVLFVSPASLWPSGPSAPSLCTSMRRKSWRDRAYP